MEELSRIGLAIFSNNGRYVQDSEDGVTTGETEKSLYGMAPYSKHIIAAVSDGNYVNFFISMKNDLYGKQPLENKT